MLSIQEFGAKLLETNDLDPVYVLLWEAKLEKEQLKRWLLAYWCFYHIGTASWIANSSETYWKRMEEAAASKAFPRCPERRHFRGQNAINSVKYLSDQGLARLFQPLLKPNTVEEVMHAVMKWVGFGPWISFKVADMIERLGIAPVAFGNVAMFLFDSPQEGAELFWKETRKGEPKPGEAGAYAVNAILNALGTRLSPPRYERGINAQEAETMLCKWKSYRNGHYEIGEDVASCRRSLLRFARCRLSQRLLTAGKAGNLWQ